MKTRLLAAGILATGLAGLTSVPATAMPPLSAAAAMPAPEGEPGHPPLPPFLHGVKLTEEQQDKLFGIMHGAMLSLYTKGKESHKAHEELQRLAMSADFDETKAKKLADSAARAQSELELIRARTDQQIFRILTAEQRKMIESRVQEPGRECGLPPRP